MIDRLGWMDSSMDRWTDGSMPVQGADSFPLADNTRARLRDGEIEKSAAI